MLGGAVLLIVSGCRTPNAYRTQADSVAGEILTDAWDQAVGRPNDAFTIEPAQDSLRRRLLLDQHLPMSIGASAGSRDDPKIKQWPDADYLTRADPISVPAKSQGGTPKITLNEALVIAASNSRLYQSQRESVFQSALRLDLERNEFRNTWAGVVDSVFSSDLGSTPETNGFVNRNSLDVSKRFANGSQFMGMLAVDLAKLLNGTQEGSTGVRLDSSISIPLMRGSGKFIVTEPLTQAQRDVVYAIYRFERFKRTFSVGIASDYLSVLQQLDRETNAIENYKRVVSSTRRARRLADAGRLPEIQVDQSVQDELRARNSWISATQASQRLLDQFKITLGLPADSMIALDSGEFDLLLNAERYARYLSGSESAGDEQVPAADAAVVLVPPSAEDAGPMEMPQQDAVLVALDNRLDLRVAVGEILDAQRGVVVAADNLRADITLLGSASLGQSRSLGSAGLDDAQLRTDKGFYSLLLGIDLPFERTVERNGYRNALIAYERTIRELQDVEDTVKLEIRNTLREMLESRETIRIQAEAVRVAQRRVDSTDLFLQAGRTEIRDLLEAQNALNTAQDALTSAVVRYRIGELEFQRDLGVLEVADDGLWTEFDPGSYDIDQIRTRLDAARPDQQPTNDDDDSARRTTK